MKRIFTVCAALLMAVAVMMGQDAPAKYGVKSARVKAVSEVMGQKVTSTSWFDDFGALETVKTSASGIEATTVSKGGKTYVVMNGTVQEAPAQETLNYRNLTPEVIEKYKIKEIGTETLLDKPCTKYSVEVSQMGQTAKLTVSVWEGYMLKSTTSVMGMTVTATVTEFEEGPVDASLFELPEGK